MRYRYVGFLCIVYFRMTAGGNNYDVNIEMKIPRVDIIHVSTAELSEHADVTEHVIVEGVAVRPGVSDRVPHPDGRHRLSLQPIKARPWRQDTSQNIKGDCQQ